MSRCNPQFKVGQRWALRGGDKALVPSVVLLAVERDSGYPLYANTRYGDYYWDGEGKSCCGTRSDDLVELIDEYDPAPSKKLPSVPAQRPAAVRVPPKRCECGKEKHGFMFHERWCLQYEHAFAAAMRVAAEVKPLPDYRTDGDRRGLAR